MRMPKLAYTIRDIPRDLWAKVKHKAIDEHITVRQLIIRALESYVREQ